MGTMISEIVALLVFLQGAPLPAATFGALLATSANAATLQSSTATIRPGEWRMRLYTPGEPKGAQKFFSAHPPAPMCVHQGETALKSFMHYSVDRCDFIRGGVQGNGFSGNIVCQVGSHTSRESVRETFAANGKSFVTRIYLTHVPDNSVPALKYYLRTTIYRGKWMGSVCPMVRRRDQFGRMLESHNRTTQTVGRANKVSGD